VNYEFAKYFSSLSFLQWRLIRRLKAFINNYHNNADHLHLVVLILERALSTGYLYKLSELVVAEYEGTNEKNWVILILIIYDIYSRIRICAHSR